MIFSSPLVPSISYILALLLSFTTSSSAWTPSSSALCPSSCHQGSTYNGKWSAYHHLHQLSLCNSPMHLDFNLHNSLDNPDTHTSIFACTTNFASTVSARDVSASGVTSPSNETACGVPLMRNTTSYFNIIQSGTQNSTSRATYIDALRIIQHDLSSQNTTSCKSTTSFMMIGNSVVGLFAGSSVPAKPFSDHVLEEIITYLTDHGASDTVYIESCGTSPSMSSQIMGVVIGKSSMLPSVQSAVSAWSHGGCMTTNSTANSTAVAWKSFDLPLLNRPLNNRPPQGRRRLTRRSDCTTVQVKSGDSCGSLAAECGISGADFTTYNSNPSLCSTLMPGQHVCCSAGTLPNLAPPPQADGTCATHAVVSGDTCSAIAGASSITVDQISSWNTLTWQFMGCGDLQIGQVICIGAGTPPMPAPIQNAVCGPQVPGTQKPDNMSVSGALASLNPCPLKVCCDIWGQCGNTAEFCTTSESASKAPGTAASGQNGCISNCGTDIIRSNSPGKPFTIGYFEGFNQQRPCLNMDASEIPLNSYTHVHFAFAIVSPSFEIQIDANSSDQWNKFMALSGPTLVLSIGGWAFSTDPTTYTILRDAVKPENRLMFAQNVVLWTEVSGIGGVDFDWEYPGAPDIPGITPGSAEDGSNFLAFLHLLRSLLPATKSLSIAAPSSYWYLKAFPIAEISKVVDYIVYMTYDLHGQWDYGNANTDSGCPGGNCLRSQVNSTETHTALSMITKAGVRSDKIVIGMTHYGRSFQMTQSGCTGPMCTYTGPNSGGTPGRCTQTAGYLAQAEIDEILQNDPSAHTSYDDDSESDVMVYNDTQWVSYMSYNTKTARTATYLSWNFLGTVDWAIDLAAFTTSEITPWQPLPDCSNARNYNTVDDVLADSGIPDACMNMYLMNALSETMSAALKSYSDILSNGYSAKYEAYATQVRTQGAAIWQVKFWNDLEKQSAYFDCLQTNNGVNQSVWCGAVKDGDASYYVVKDQTAFCNDLASLYNLDCAWIVEKPTPYMNRRLSDSKCGQAHNCPSDTWSELYQPSFDPNAPILDPSVLITKALGNLTDFSSWLHESALAAQVYLFPELNADAVDGASTLVFSVQAAAAAMQNVADVGQKAEDQQRKDMIIGFITAFLLLLPAVGELAEGVAVLAQVGRIANLIDVAGNTALGIYGAVEDPSSAPMAIAGILLGGAALREDFAWGKAAARNRGMGQDVIKSMGADVATNLGKVQKTCKRCNA